jgi:hypothetical protein
MAYDAGCNVINLSLGSPNAWSVTRDSQSEVINKIAAKGVSSKFMRTSSIWSEMRN